ncbi:hypothetical protein ACQEV9_14525 [Streptomyces chartreusis]|uniref:hypothetical protein n=1 Tax=Streptomyces chartreusis TaxID=1969 RepID=UPI003D8CA6D4
MGAAHAHITALADHLSTFTTAVRGLSSPPESPIRRGAHEGPHTPLLGRKERQLSARTVRPSFDDIVRDCQKALVAQTKAGGEGRPNACKDVKDDDGNVNDSIGGE